MTEEKRNSNTAKFIRALKNKDQEKTDLYFKQAVREQARKYIQSINNEE